MTPLAVVQQTARPILEFARGWMMAPETRDRGKELGLTSPFGFWVNGRAGALGDVSAEVAAAAIGFMSPEQVRIEWEAREGNTPFDAVAAWNSAAETWGRRALAAVAESDLAELEELAAIVIGAAQPSVGALFTAFRETDPLSGDLGGRVTHRLNVLRELRGGAHLSAVQAAGLGPLGAIISTDDPVRGGPSWAATFGWPGPYPEPDTDARRLAEELTDRICVPAYSALSADQGARFVELVVAVRAAV